LSLLPGAGTLDVLMIGGVRRRSEAWTGAAMWAQLVKMTLRSDGDPDVAGLMSQLQAAEQPDSGLLRTLTMRDQENPRTVYTLVVFDSEEKARAREQDPRRAEALTAVRAAMAEMFDGPAEFTNLTVLWDS
jgi:hypothetical protein